MTGHRRERFDRTQALGIISLVILLTAVPSWLALGLIIGFINGLSQ